MNRLFNQQTSRCELVSCEATAADVVTVVWRLSGNVNLGPAGLAIKPYVVTTTLRVDDDNLVVFQEDAFSLPGWDLLLSSLVPALRPWLAPEAPQVEVLRAERGK